MKRGPLIGGTATEAAVPAITLAFELAPPQPNAYQSKAVDVGALSSRQAENLRRLFDTLHDGHYRLTNGRHIDTATDVIRWLLENLA